LRKALALAASLAPAALVFGSIAAVAYADFIVSSISLGYLYFLPLGIGAMSCGSRVSYGLIAVAYFCMTSSGLLIPAQRPGLRKI